MAAFFPFSAETAGVIVRVSVSVIHEASDEHARRWMWSYHIRIENQRTEAVQLLDRRWEIRDANGATNVVEGPGVVGEQPIIEPGERYDYVSGCPLATPTGQMVGHYRMRCADGRELIVAIPAFPLTAPVARA